MTSTHDQVIEHFEKTVHADMSRGLTAVTDMLIQAGFSNKQAAQATLMLCAEWLKVTLEVEV